MSKTIDQRVVEMRFDNANFEKNVSTSMSTLDKLKKSLKFEDSAKGFDNISKAAGRVDMGGLSSGIESVRLKFSALEVMAVTALTNIANRAVDTGLQLVKSLSVDQIAAGFEKFGEKTTSVATLLAQGNAMEDVEKQLARLNWFTDETSYNYTDMVSNISKFTASGKGLEESVTAMEGIANWAALSGQNAQTASRAMYQISQAMGAGIMRLEDYKSIQNASMDTDEFRQKTLDAAVALGTLEKNADGTYSSLVGEAASFSKSQFTTMLTKGAWFTSDVMMEVFNDYSSAVDQIYEYAEEKGITASQAIEELGDQVDAFGLKAFRSAQEAKTFGDAIDSTKDAVSTGWMNTFEILFGNYEEARVLWTDLANAMYDVFASGAEARNELLQGWKDLGGRDMLIEGFWNSWYAFFGDGEEVLGILGAIKEAFSEIFPPMTSERLLQITEKFRDLTEKFKMSDEAATNLKNTFKGFFAALDIGRQGLKALGEIFTHLLQKILPTEDGILGVTGSIGEWIVSIDETIKSGDGLAKFVENVNGAIDTLADKIRIAKDYIVDLIRSWTGIDSLQDLLSRVFSGISNLVSGATEHIGSFKDVLSSIGAVVSKVVGGVWKTLKAVFGWVSDNISISDIFAGLAGGGIFAVGKKLSGLIEKIKDALDTLFGDGEIKIGGKFADVMNSIHDTLTSFQNGIKISSIVAVAVAVGILSASIKAIADLDVGQITKSLFAVGAMLAMLSATMKSLSKTLSGLGSKGLIKAGVSLVLVAASVSILAGAMKKLADLSLGDIAKGLIALGGGLLELSIGLKIIDKTKIKLSTSIGMLALAASCTILADALKKFGEMSWDEIGKGLVGMGGALTELVVAVSILGKFGGGKSLFGGLAILIVVQSLGKMADGLKAFGEMSWDEIGRGLTAMGGALAELGLVLGLLGKFAGFSSVFASGAILMIVQGLDDIANALERFAGMTWDEIGRGLAGMGGALGEIALITGLLGGLVGFSAIFAAGAILIVIQGLADLAEAFKSFAGMTWDEIGKGLVGMGGALTEVGTITGLLGALTGLSGLLGAGALLLAIQGLGDLADAFKKFSEMSWDEIGRGLVGMGGALLEVGVITGALGAIAGLPALLGSGAILLAVQGLGDLADALKKFGEMSWDEIGRGLSAMGGALGELALGGVLNTLSGLGALSISAVAEPLGTLADSVKKWAGVTIPDGLGARLAVLAAAVSSFTFSGVGAASLAIAAEPVGVLADSVNKWTNVTIPDGLTEKMSTLAAGIEKFTFAGLGAGALSSAAPGVGDMADAITKWSGVTVPEGLENGLTQIANGVKAFSFAFAGGWSLGAITEPLGDLAGSIKKWRTVSVPDGLEEGLTQIANGVKAFSLAFVGGWSLDAITEPLGDLADTIKKWDGISIPEDIGDGLKALSSGVIAFSLAFIGGWSLAAITGPLGDLADSVVKWKDVSVPSTLSSDLTRLAAGVTAFSDVPNVTVSANALKKISAAAVELSNTDFPSISSGLRSLTSAIKNLATIETVEKSLSNFGSELVEKVVTPIKSATKEFKDTGSALADSFKNGISARSSTLVSKMKTIVKSLVSAITLRKSDFKTAGGDLIKELINGIEGQASGLNTKITSLISIGIQVVRSYYMQFYSAGGYLAMGIANGISASGNAVSAASSNIAARAVASAKSKLQINSPSKVGYQIGDYFGVGFANGITDNIRNAGMTSEKLADSATSGLTNVVSKIAAAINNDMDTAPTIRPVLDLTEIQNGSVAMANLMNTLSGRPVEGTVSIAARTANTMNRTGLASTPASEGNTRPQNTESTTNNFYITGTDPRAIADEVDRKLQRRVERRKAAWA